MDSILSRTRAALRDLAIIVREVGEQMTCICLVCHRSWLFASAVKLHADGCVAGMVGA